VRAHRLNWIAFESPNEPIRVKAKIRHRHEAADAEVQMKGDKALVTFDDPQRAITPGQAVVFYDEDTVVGGGWIC
jgi:tRNA-specific 2-thiouridylase